MAGVAFDEMNGFPRQNATLCREGNTHVRLNLVEICAFVLVAANAMCMTLANANA